MTAVHSKGRTADLATAGVIYPAVVLAIVLAISPYFSVGWDPQIFASAGRALIDNSDPFDLYRVSRQVWGDWGYPYPPLYAILLAPIMGLAGALPLSLDWVLVRALPVVSDLTVAGFLYLILLRRGAGRRMARLGALVWLFNPITLYQTAIQAHQESSWLACVVVAYALLQSGQGQRASGRCGGAARSFAVLPSLLMACAVALKQSAILFYIPYVVWMLLERERRWQRLATAGALLVIVLGGLSLPYHLHSADFFYLVYVAVSNMPVQTQSALVWLLGLRSLLTEQTRSSLFVLQYQSVMTMALALLVSWLALRRDRDLFRAGLLVALLFFLTSKKVMGYHYPLLLPFLLVYALPQHRFDLIGIGVLAASWIIVSPYYAPWAKAEHLALYAAMGTPNTLLWLWLFVHVWNRRSRIHVAVIDITEGTRDGGAVIVAVAMVTVGMVASSLVQPWSAGPWPLRAVLLVAVLALSVLLAVPVARWLGVGGARLSGGHLLTAVLLIPVHFAAFALTAESTRIIENLLSS